MADWNLLRSALNSAGDSVRFTWDELDALVGGLPASATNHRAWWAGDRPHVHVWRSAGYSVRNLVLAREVTFTRGGATSAVPAVTAESDAAPKASPTLLLVACVKEKLPSPAAARDLYVSPLFRKERSYAERTGLPWFILSAEHGLVAPDEWLAPYERYLPDTPPSFRRAWGAWVIERLALLAGDLTGRVIEVHAGSAYVDVLRAPLAEKGASLHEPLAGLAMGQRLAWYGDVSTRDVVETPAEPTEAHPSAAEFCERLTETSAALAPSEFVARGPLGLKVPGLYSWWVDPDGARDLSVGLGQHLEPGLIYAGLAGATRWPSGRRSTNTLWSRISGMHLGRRHEFSTFRRTLGSVLASARHAAEIDEVKLSAWMSEHLTVVAIPFDDADTLGHLEDDVLRELDPPLNLQGMKKTETRQRLTELRSLHAGKRATPSV